MRHIKSARRLVVCFSVLLACATAQAQEDPSAYAKMGSGLWNALARRQVEGLPSHLLPFFVFTDGKSLTIAPQAFVASYDTPPSNPIKRVLPGPGTVADSGKYPVIPLKSFMQANASHVNAVTQSRPVKTGVLNIYTTTLGNPTTVEFMGK